MLRFIEEILQTASAVSGFYGAWLWLKASRVHPQPGPGINSGLEDIQRGAWIDALLQSARESADLNQRAAVATAVAVVGQAAAALLARFAMIG